jgi:hypothetical protein
VPGSSFPREEAGLCRFWQPERCHQETIAIHTVFLGRDRYTVVVCQYPSALCPHVCGRNRLWDPGKV